MGKHLQTLKMLRKIALEHCSSGQPDLASMALELGRVVHLHTAELSSHLATLHAGQRGFERWLLAERSKPDIRALVQSWPPNYRAPMHDHAGSWGLDLALHGALEVQSYARDPRSGDLLPHSRNWLGPGDGNWFEDDRNYAHRCRNLSKNEAALSLHIYGGDLADCRACDAPVLSDQHQRVVSPQKTVMAGRFRG